jgi:FtsZ-binding cell division protein ZapB
METSGVFLKYMSRKKNSIDEVEQLQIEVRKLKSENRHLQKELKKNNKKYKPQHDKIDLIEEEHNDKHICNECGKGRIITTELGPRKLVTCTVCEYRKTLKNG